MVRFALLAALSLTFPAGAQAAERKLDLSNIRGLILAAGVTAEISSTKGPAEAKLSGDPTAIEQFALEADEAVYTLRYTGQVPLSAEEMAKVTLSVKTPYLGYFSNARGGVVTFRDFATKGLLLEQGYSGFTDFQGEQFGGSVTLSGTCEAVNVGFRGPGRIDARDFKCKTVWIGAEGDGHLDVYASEAFKSQLAGSVTVAVAGDPKYCLARTAGASSARCGDRVAETFTDE